jgi:hypothetical protein
MKSTIYVVLFLVILLVLFFALSVLVPQHWHQYYSEESNNDIHPRVYYPLFWHFQEANFTIVFEPVIEIELLPDMVDRDKVDYISASTSFGSLQISGIGSNSSLRKNCRYDYSFLSSPRLVIGTDQFQKEFLFTNNLNTVSVDGTDYKLDYRTPLVLYVQKDGTISKIDSFVEEFGVELNEVLEHPTRLSRALRENRQQDDSP